MALHARVTGAAARAPLPTERDQGENMLRAMAMILAFCWQGQAQVEFEAASVKIAAKPALPPTMPAPGTPGLHGGLPRAIMTGGPGTTSPGSILYRNVTLRDLVQKAYGVMAFQVSAPAWCDNDRYDVQAKLPAGASVGDFQVMLQHLLAARFHLALHREERETSGYQLAVDTKGSKLKESTVGPAPRMLVDFGGSPIVDYRIIATAQSMAELAKVLEKHLNCPVTDLTVLKGTYDFELQFAIEPLDAEANGKPPVLPSVATALRNQLGLRFDRDKVKIEMLVVESADRVPTEN
jgi:uncharacterized protein (TIGR03435 family)